MTTCARFLPLQHDQYTRFMPCVSSFFQCRGQGTASQGRPARSPHPRRKLHTHTSCSFFCLVFQHQDIQGVSRGRPTRSLSPRRRIETASLSREIVDDMRSTRSPRHRAAGDTLVGLHLLARAWCSGYAHFVNTRVCICLRIDSCQATAV